MAETGLYVKIMQESLERKRGYLSELLKLTKEQGVIAKGEPFDEDGFEALVEKKEILINNINEIDKGFTAVYDRVRSEVLEDRDIFADDLKKMQQSIKACVDLGMKIEAEEERNRMSLEQVFAFRFKGLKQIKQSKSVANKYYKSMANGMVNDSMLYDRKK